MYMHLTPSSLSLSLSLPSLPLILLQIGGEEEPGIGMNHNDEGNPDDEWQEDDWDENDPEESVRSKAVANSGETEGT